MFEGLLRRFGYTKLNRAESILLSVVMNASIDNKDVFIDSLKRKKTQKIYIKDGKKSKMVAEIRLV